MDQIDPDDAESLLLLKVGLVEHPDVDDDVVGLGLGGRLKADPHPSVGFVLGLVRTCGDRVGEGEECPLRPDLLVQALDEKVILVIEHFAEALATHEPRALPVDRVRECHVVGGDRLGHGPRRAPHVKEPPRDFLTSPDLGEGAVDRFGHVDLKRLLVGLQVEMRAHGVRF